MSQRKHRCGGSLGPANVEIRTEMEGFLIIHAVPGLICDRCHEELLEHHTARELQTLNPSSIWFTSVQPHSSAVEITLTAPSSSCVTV